MNNFTRIQYQKLTARQQENYNFQKVSAVLADYGFTTIRLSDDWQGADFIAQHVDRMTFLRVQLKGRPTFDQRYQGRDLHICFRSDDQWYLYPHDEVLASLLALSNVGTTESWMKRGNYSFPRLPKRYQAILEPYKL